MKHDDRNFRRARRARRAFLESGATTLSLTPLNGGPFPPAQACVPKAPRYDNCLAPKPAS